MTDDPNRLVVVASVPTEEEAAVIVAALETRGVQAGFSGALTAGFRAEAPGDVHIMVREVDAVRAREILDQLEKGAS